MTKYFTERMRKMDNKFLLSLLNSVSVSGYEEILQQKVEAEMRPWASWSCAAGTRSPTAVPEKEVSPVCMPQLSIHR